MGKGGGITVVGGPGPWPVAVDWGAGAGDGTDDHPESKAQQHRGKNMQCPTTTPLRTRRTRSEPHAYSIHYLGTPVSAPSPLPSPFPAPILAPTPTLRPYLNPIPASPRSPERMTGK